MAVFPAVPLSALEIIAALLTILLTVGAFIAGLWYWSLDRQTQNYDKQLRSDILEDDAFRGIRSAGRAKFIVTSDSTISKLTTSVQKGIGRVSDKPDKIVALDGDTLEDRYKAMIRERVRDIPGKNILAPELIAAIRNYYAYKLALSREDVGSTVIEHFRDRFEGYKYASKVNELAKSENYANVSLITEPGSGGERDPLNDVFLDIVEAAERYCVSPITDVDEKHAQIERCREHLMLAFYVLWVQRMKGVEVQRDLSEDDCITAFRTDIRDRDNWGYWLLPRDKCDDDEFRRLRYIAWKVNDIIEYHWDGVDYSILYPHGESILEMERVETPFFMSLKNEEEYRGGGPSTDT